MNPIAEEIKSYLGIASDTESEENSLKHYGMPRRSGRYPWGSGEDPYQHSMDFLGRVQDMRKKNFTYTDENGKTWTGDNAIAKSMGLTSSEFRIELSLCNSERRMRQVATAQRLKEKEGLGPTEIGRRMGVRESTVRSWLEEKSAAKMVEARLTADFIQDQVDKYGMVDVGKGAAAELRISNERMKEALYILENNGYPVYGGGVPNITNAGKQLNQTVVCVPGTKKNEIYDFERVHGLNEEQYISRDGGVTFEKKFNYPASMDSKRMMIRYAEDGGVDKDGIVELRRNVPDLSLGESRYSQVRILVDGTHYIKGMAVYSDDMPDGVDVIFNTNKTKGTPMTKVLKEIKPDPDNPFGSLIKDADQGGQYWYTDKDGNKKLGLINKRADEGDWTEWKDALPSQFLSKQNLSMINKQLKIAKQDKQAEFDEIMALENPTLKKHYLSEFADSCDAAATSLQAAALPGQKYHVIIPVNNLKDNEVYAPQYENGSKLALIRYPHGGTFEIPILTVNNKNTTAKSIIGTDSIDAVGINKKVADRLSGADFDGDTVMCIPTHDSKGKVKITSTPPLKGLEGFDPKLEYGPETYKGRDVKLMSKGNVQKQMGVISNLITDMTLQGASQDEMAAAVRHSMVVIDAYKHKLDYKQSEMDNNISALHEKYQGKKTGGAYTIISKAKGQESVGKRQGSPHVNIKGSKYYDPTKPEGSLVYKTADDLYYPIRKYDKATKTMTMTLTNGKKVSYRVDNEAESEKYSAVKKVNPDTGEVTYTNKAGDISYRVDKRTQKSTKMAETDDANTLVSPLKHPKELAYADYANTMKAMANQARKEMMSTGKISYSSEAKAKYREEYDSLMRKLNDAQLNATRERAAQRMANAELKYKLDNQNIEKGEIKKAGQQALSKYRTTYSAISRKDRSIDITDREWAAIQAGAISETQLKSILSNTDPDKLRQRAMPKNSTTLNKAKVTRAKNLASNGYTLEEIARKLGVSTSTVSSYLNK
jgi:predicted transcriptional regulator